MFRGDDPQTQAKMERSRNAENKGRRAGVYAKYSTTGQGVVEFAARVDFGLTYVEEPFMAYGAKVDMDDVRDALGLDDDQSPSALPISSGLVTDWDLDERGHYTGAWVAVTVYYPPSLPASAPIDMEHFFSFEAVALKNIPFDPSAE